MGGTFHVKSPRKKHEENSNRGDLEAVTKGFSGSDHDSQKGKSGISYNTHWKDVWHRDGFRDPLGQYGPDTPHGPLPFDKLPDAVIRRLEAHTDGHTFKIRTTAAGIKHAAKAGLDYVIVELKPGNAWTLTDLRYFKRVARRAGIKLRIGVMRDTRNWRRVVAMATLLRIRVVVFRAPGA